MWRRKEETRSVAERDIEGEIEGVGEEDKEFIHAIESEEAILCGGLGGIVKP